MEVTVGVCVCVFTFSNCIQYDIVLERILIVYILFVVQSNHQMCFSSMMMMISLLNRIEISRWLLETATLIIMFKLHYIL